MIYYYNGFYNDHVGTINISNYNLLFIIINLLFILYFYRELIILFIFIL